MEQDRLDLFYDFADQIVQATYGNHAGYAEFSCPICGGTAIARGRVLHGYVRCTSCGIGASRKKPGAEPPSCAKEILSNGSYRERCRQIDMLPDEQCRELLKYCTDFLIRQGGRI